MLPFLFSLRARPYCWALRPKALGGYREPETIREFPAFSWLTVVAREYVLLLKMLLMIEPAVFFNPCSIFDMNV
jgi:hypothetical protein